ncbi:uncharacterized protein LOC101850490 [Aplysia californica]|uniref:Uncharacterized protein LOC101850490 n=1 Tax=Aplysia californica TaxID=6500 RepID=A0ABM1A3X3_APLCA|nr:uncharacterized protein LOC101850490 [Aplysia californica]
MKKMWVVQLISVVVFLGLCGGQDLAQQVCSTDRSQVDVNVAGANVILGGLFEIRGKGTGGYGCGRPVPDLMQIFEAARFTIKFINDNTGYLPGVRLGMRSYDTCFSAGQALNALEKIFPQSVSSNPYCSPQSSVTPGVIGPLSSGPTIAAADLAGRLSISLISPRADSPVLSDKLKYPTFLRTVPPSGVQAKALVALLAYLKWENVMVMYVDTAYGHSLYQELLQATYGQVVCVSKTLMLESSTNETLYKEILVDMGPLPFTPVVFLGTNVNARTMLRASVEVGDSREIQWVFSDLDVAQDISGIQTAPGVLTIQARAPLVSAFRDYFTQLELNPRTSNPDNPWFEDWYEENYGCTLRGGSNPCPTRTLSDLKNKFAQSPWAVATMKAVFAYAETIRSVCSPFGGGVCPALQTMSPSDFHNRLKNINYQFPSTFGISELRNQFIKFGANGDLEVPEYTVYNYNNRGGSFAFESVGIYESSGLKMSVAPMVYDVLRTTEMITLTKDCATFGCDTCVLPQRRVTLRYQPGSVVIASLVDAHKAGRAPFTCGQGSASALTALVAAEWAAGEFKRNNPGKLRGVSLGSLVADVCPDSYVSDGFLADLLSGNNRLMDSSGLIIRPDNIQAFVDHTGNGQAKSISSILSHYMIPEVQTGATTSMLSSSEQSYFSRAIPSEEVYFTAIASLLQRLGWKYVEVVTYSSGMYHEQTKVFRRVAAKYGICVAGVEDLSDGYPAVLGRLQNSVWSVVVVIGSVDDLQALLNARTTGSGTRSIQFISGVESFSRNPALLTGLGSAADSLIMLEPELAPNSAFSTWLRGLSRSEIVVHPFLRELFEITNNCSLDPATHGLYSQACDNNDALNVFQDKVQYVIESVYTVADKLHDVITEVCQNNNYDGLCTSFRSATDIGSRLNAKIRNSGRSASGFEIKNGEGVTNFNIYLRNVAQATYTQLAVFDSENLRLLQENYGPLGSYGGRANTCPGVCVQCHYLYTMQSGYFVPGDWIIAGAFSVSNSGPVELQPYVCGSIREVNGPQYTTAMMYAIEQVNKGLAPVSVKGVKIGGLALDHCNDEGRVNLLVSDIYSGFLRDMGVDPTHILSWLTDNTGSTHDAATVLEPLDVAMVSPSATSASLMDYPTFHRTVQGDITTATALVKVIKSLGFPYIQVVYSDSGYGRGGLKTLTAVTEQEGICITSSVALESEDKAADVVASLVASPTQVVVSFMSTSHTRALFAATVNNAAARSQLLFLLPEPYDKLVAQYAGQLSQPILSLQLAKSNLASYGQYLDSSPVENPYFARYYMSVKNCNLPGYSKYSTPCPSQPSLAPITQDPSFEQDNFVESTIDAVYASVDALDRTIQHFCGADYTEPCLEFYMAPDRRERYNALLNSATFVSESKSMFRFLEREGDTTYDILQSSGSQYQKVGSYAGVYLDMDETRLRQYPGVVSECPPPCLDCIMRGLNFSHTPGDLYLAGVFDVHERSLSPFTCGRINTLHGFLLLEAFHYAINQVNDKKGPFADILPGTRLGGIGLDSCGSQVRGGYIVSNIHNGIFSLARDGVFITPSEIDAYIGAYDSGSSMYLSRILTDLKIPQISYASSSSLLNDSRLYPYFYRTVPTDFNQIKAILSFLNEKNIRYVQILYMGNENGRTVKDTLEALASEYRVCVAQSVDYIDLGIPSRETSNAVVSRLIEKPAANTVISFLHTEYVNSVLKAVGRSDRARGKLRFFGSDAWADNQEAIEDAEDYAVDSITIKLDSDDVESFETYMSSKTLANSKENPWFEEYYQEIHQCYTSKTNTMGYPRQCPLSLQSIIDSRGYQQDPGVVYVMNAIYAAAYGLHATLQQYCGKNYAGVCQAYSNNVLRREQLSTKLADVEFVDPVGNKFFFEDRHGVSSFRFNSIVKGSIVGANYIQIGYYNTSGGTISVDNNYVSKWNSGCNREDACSECPAIRDSSVRYLILDSTKNIPADATTVVAFFDVHKQGVDPYRCGSLNVPGFHQLLAFLYSVENLFLSKVEGSATNGVYNKGIRFLIVDTCSNSLRVDQDLFGLLQGEGLCNTNFDDEGYTINMNNIGAVVTSGDHNTMAAARLLEAPGVTYVSPNAMSPDLDGQRYLARTISPVSGQMLALVKLLNSLDWNYVDVVYEDSENGMEPWERFSYYASMRKVCYGNSVRAAMDASEADLKSLLNLLSGSSGSRAVVLLGGEKFVRSVIKAAADSSVGREYVWLVASDWDFSEDDLKDLIPNDYQLKIVTVQRVTDKVSSFDLNYVAQLRYEPLDGDRNNGQVPRPWFEEFFQLVHGCTLSDAITPIYAPAGSPPRPECDKNKKVDVADVNQDEYVLNTIAAAFAVTDGLNRQLVSCNGVNCSHANLGSSSIRAQIRAQILNSEWALTTGAPPQVTLYDNTNLVLNFNPMQWWDTGYQVRLWTVTKDADGVATVGSTELWKGVINLSVEDIEALKKQVDLESRCDQDTAQGSCGCTFDVYTPAQQVTDPRMTSYVRNYYYYINDGSARYYWPKWAIAVSVATGVGFIVTVALFLALLCAYPMRGGTTVLGYMAIVGILAIYAINFAFFVHASEATCGTRRFLMGVVYMIAFAPLLIKAIDNWRFGHMDYAAQRYSGISSALVLFLMACTLVLIQCIVPIIWLILVHPTATLRGQTGDFHDIWWCDPIADYDLGLVTSFIFVMFIVFITAIFSAMAYDTDRNNFESRWILFACIATAGCFLVWMTVTTNADPYIRDPVVAIANFVNATLLMLILPLRKTVLMCRALREKQEEKEIMEVVGEVSYDNYNNSYNNPTFELNDYDNDYVEG